MWFLRSQVSVDAGSRRGRTAAYYTIGPASGGGDGAAMTQRPPLRPPARASRCRRSSARPPAPMTASHVDGPTVLRAVRAAVANLEAHVDEVDALNVFPVPDGDTGSNMLATMRAALAEAERLPDARRDLASVAEALSRGALSGARGNSGVILSQIIRGMTGGCRRAPARQRREPRAGTAPRLRGRLRGGPHARWKAPS